MILIKAALCQFTYHTGKLSVCVNFFHVSLSVSSICPFVSVFTFEPDFLLRSMSFASVFPLRSMSFASVFPLRSMSFASVFSLRSMSVASVCRLNKIVCFCYFFASVCLFRPFVLLCPFLHLSQFFRCVVCPLRQFFRCVVYPLRQFFLRQLVLRVSFSVA